MPHYFRKHIYDNIDIYDHMIFSNNTLATLMRKVMDKWYFMNLISNSDYRRDVFKNQQ